MSQSMISLNRTSRMKLDDFASQKSEIDDKLSREMDRLAQLQESLTRSDQLTDNMLTILTSFESRLHKLEETITPVYQETGNLQRRHENIEKTLSSLDSVLGYYHVAEEVEPIIREGLASNLDNYIGAMEKLQKAVNYFNKTSPESAEMSQVMTLFESGKDSVEREFRNILTRHSKPVPAVIILDCLTVDEELPNEEPTPIEHFPEKVKAELCQLATWLLGSGQPTDYMHAYTSIRSTILVKSLHCLRDHLKSGSRDSATVSMTHSPALVRTPVSCDTLSRPHSSPQGFLQRTMSKLKRSDSTSSSKLKTPKETQAMKALKRMKFVRRASTTLKNSLAQLEAAGLKKTSSVGNELKEEGIDFDIDFYITGVSALLKLIQSEATLMNGVIPEKKKRKVFDDLIQAALDSIVKEGETIGTSIRRAIGRHEHQAVLAIFPVLKHLRSIKSDFDVTLEGCQAPTRSKLITLISSLDATGAKALEEFVDNIRNDPHTSSNMPKDGTVHELTSNTIIFLEQLLEFTDTAGAMLMTQDPTALPTPDRPKVKLAEFVTKSLSALGLNLSNKTETYSDSTLRSIFMLNNYNYILKSLKRCGLMTLILEYWNADVEKYYDDQILEQKRVYSQRTRMLSLIVLVNPEVEKHYDAQLKMHKKQYLQSWSKVLHYIMEITNPLSSQKLADSSTKLKDKERQNIKDKFAGFNKEMEDIHRIQKTYAIPDPDMKDSLKQDNKDYVLPSYKIFYDKYRPTNFTKNPEKYIKYRVEDVSRCIDQFFDSAA